MSAEHGGIWPLLSQRARGLQQSPSRPTATSRMSLGPKLAIRVLTYICSGEVHSWLPLGASLTHRGRLTGAWAALLFPIRRVIRGSRLVALLSAKSRCGNGSQFVTRYLARASGAAARTFQPPSGAVLSLAAGNPIPAGHQPPRSIHSAHCLPSRPEGQMQLDGVASKSCVLGGKQCQ